MLVTNHVLAGAVLGTLVRRPALALPVGIASHFVLDAVPHWGDVPYSTFLRVAVVDGLTGLAAMALLSRSAPEADRLAVLAGMAGGAFPDLNKPSELFFGIDPFPALVAGFHSRIQDESPDRLLQEFVVAGTLLGVLALLRSRR